MIDSAANNPIAILTLVCIASGLAMWLRRAETKARGIRAGVDGYLPVVMIWVILTPLDMSLLPAISETEPLGSLSGLVAIGAWLFALVTSAFLALQSLHWERALFALIGLLAAFFLSAEASVLLSLNPSGYLDAAYVGTAIALSIASLLIVFGRHRNRDLRTISTWSGAAWFLDSAVAVPLILGTMLMMISPDLNTVARASLVVTAACGLASLAWREVSGLRVRFKTAMTD